MATTENTRTSDIAARVIPAPEVRAAGWRGITVALASSDILAVAIAATTSRLLTGHALDRPEFAGEVGVALVVVGCLAARGLYSRDRLTVDHTTLDELPTIAIVAMVAAWTVVVAGFVYNPGATDSRAALVAFWAAIVVCTAGFRAAVRIVARRRGHLRQRVLIVGTDHLGRRLARKLRSHVEYGIDVVGFVDEAESDAGGHGDDPVPHLGAIRDVPALVQHHRIDRVIVAFATADNADLIEIVRRCPSVHVDIVPRLYDALGPQLEVTAIEGLPVLTVRGGQQDAVSSFLKRGMDVTGALVGLALTWPIFLWCWWRIPRESSGPVFFRQERLGQGMRPFSSLKFRTMGVDTPTDEHEAHVKASMAVDASPETSGLFKLSRQSHVTRSGAWLRRTSIDELPQLINVLRGEMSLVGPRPCIPYETQYFEPHHFVRFDVPQGLTGFWQVTARAHASFREALDMDVAYARTRSLGLDVRILLRTPLQVIRQRKGTA